MKTAFLVLLTASLFAYADEKSDQKQIQEHSQAYVSAYNRGDAKAIALLWAPDAIYVNPQTGVELNGREEIEEKFRSLFQENKGLKIDVKINSITFPENDVALEKGIVVFLQDNQEKEKTIFKAELQKINDTWLLKQIREVSHVEAPTQYENLKAIEWIIGKWIDEDEDSSIVSDFQWDKYKNFITQHFTVTIEDQLSLEGKQIIAWDPIKKKIRSWIFDSDGTFGEGFWTKKDKSWVVETTQTLTDGRRGSATNIYTPIDANSYTWQSVQRQVGDELLPDIEPVTVIRKQGS